MLFLKKWKWNFYGFVRERFDQDLIQSFTNDSMSQKIEFFTNSFANDYIFEYVISLIFQTIQSFTNDLAVLMNELLRNDRILNDFKTELDSSRTIRSNKYLIYKNNQNCFNLDLRMSTNLNQFWILTLKISLDKLSAKNTSKFDSFYA